MLLVEGRLDHPVMRTALERAPGMEVTWERTDAIDDSRVRMLVWASGGEFGAFDAGIADDPTVARPSRVIPVDDRRLYQTELIDEGLRKSTYPLMVEEGGVFQELTGTVDGWSFRAALPDRDALARLVEFCRGHDIGFEFHSVHQAEAHSGLPEYGLTDRQRETLATAVERGYFRVPRECSLSELATALGVSETAASERLRRGMGRLVARTVGR